MKRRTFADLESKQVAFYLPKFRKFHDDVRSLGWRDKESQVFRFEALEQLFYHEKRRDFSIHEIGCGLGHFYEYLRQKNYDVDYSGSDIVGELIDRCRKLYPDGSFSQTCIIEDIKKLKRTIGGADYYCLIGVFNPIGNNSKKIWEDFILQSVSNMFLLAKKGIAFNFLTSHSDYYDKDLYYADPGKMLNWCVGNLSRYVSLHHDSAAYDFTVYVYKDAFIESLYPYIVKRKNERRLQQNKGIKQR